MRMEWFVDQFLVKQPGKIKTSVLDVGSYDVNGSYRHFFPDSDFDYTGLDMAPGPNVDIALTNPYDWRVIPDDSYDVVVSGQAFEHIEFFWITMEEMSRVLKPNGFMCIIAPLGFKEHRHPVDCYRFFTDGMVALARYVSLEILHAHTNSGLSHDSTAWFSTDKADSMLVAKKPFSGPPPAFERQTYNCVPAEHSRLRQPLVSMSERSALLLSKTNKQLEIPAEEPRPLDVATVNSPAEGKSNVLKRVLTKLKGL